MTSDGGEEATVWIALRRYWRYALALGVISGVFAWWVMGYVAGVVIGLGLFGGTILTGWEIDPLLRSEHRARRYLDRRRG